MENNLLFALKISGLGIVVLLLILIALAGIVYLMTRFILDKPEEEEEVIEEAPRAVITDIEETQENRKLAAAVALAIARAQAETQSVEIESEISSGSLNSWRHFGLQRRLSQPSTIWRTR